MPEAKAQLGQVATVFLPVANQDRALDFYVGTLGFEKKVDFSRGDDYRWVEVAPPGSGVGIALVAAAEGTAEPSDQTYFAIASEDLEADHAALEAAGVEVEAIATGESSRGGLISLDVTVHEPVPAQFCMRDVDGNRILVVEPPS